MLGIQGSQEMLLPASSVLLPVIQVGGVRLRAVFVLLMAILAQKENIGEATTPRLGDLLLVPPGNHMMSGEIARRSTANAAIIFHGQKELGEPLRIQFA